MFNRGQIIAGMFFNAIVLLLIAKFATGSLNPMEAFRGNSLLLKLIIGFFLLTLGMNVIALLFRKGLENERCAKDGLALLEYAGSHGNPVRCNFCGRWFHGHCFRAEGGTALTGCKQSPCPSARSEFS